MRQTDIKTIYLSTEELKQVIIDYVGQHNYELTQLLIRHELQIILTEDGLTLRIPKEIETFNTEPEFVVNDKE